LMCNRPDSGSARSSIRIRGWANSTTCRPGLHMNGRARTGGGQNPAATRRIPWQAPSRPPTPRPSTAMPHHAQPMANQGPLVSRAGALSASDASHAPVMHAALMKGDVHDRAHSHPPLCARRALPHQRPTNRRAGGGSGIRSTKDTNMTSTLSCGTMGTLPYWRDRSALSMVRRWPREGTRARSMIYDQGSASWLCG
jgi:hypothetical protein